MNIVQVGPYPLFADCIKGGVESSVFGLAQELANSHIVDVFDLPRIGGKDIVERKGSLTIHRYANTGKYNQDAVDRGKEMLRDILALHPDIVHIHGTGLISSVFIQSCQIVWDTSSADCSWTSTRREKECLIKTSIAQTFIPTCCAIPHGI